MSEYERKANNFLKRNGIAIQKIYLGKEVNQNWDEERERDTYMVNIQTLNGNMQIKFWDSINNTIKNRINKQSGKPRVCPSNYDILSCLQKYDVGDIEDFIQEYGYEIKKKGDLTRILNIYKAVTKEYNDVCRCFLGTELEELMEIQ